MIEVQETFIDDQRLPVLWLITRGGDEPLDRVVEWFREHRSMLVRAQDLHGAVLVRGFAALRAAEDFARVLRQLSPELMDYVGGSAPRSVAFERVFNATALPGHFSLPLHQEMAYQEYRPDRLALFCRVPAAHGGETTLGDARRVTSSIDAGVRRRCEPLLRVQRALRRERLENRTRPWMDVFGTDDRDAVQKIADGKGWRIAWRPDGSLLLDQVMRTSRTHPATGARVWANQLHYHTPEGMVRWAEADRRSDDVAYYRECLTRASDTLDHVLLEDGTPVPSEDAEHVWEVLSRAEVPLRWERGDVLLLDNVLAMHGRRPFQGDRSILVGMYRDGADDAQPTGGAP